jgi:hypothetical protein
MIDLVAFYDEMEKIAFGWEDIKRVGRMAKKRMIKAPRSSQIVGMGPSAYPGGTQRMAVTQAQEMAQAGHIPQASVEATKKLYGQIGGRIATPRRGGMVGALTGEAAQEVGLPAAKTLTGKGKRAIESVGYGHELDELALGKKKLQPFFGGTFGHAHPDVILRERNRLLTLPPEVRGEVGGVFGKLRQVGGEEALLERATRGVSGRGLTHTSGPRLSRHARKRISKRMEELAKEQAGSEFM